jgi:hypothetical protein
MEQQTESRPAVAVWVRVFACLLAVGSVWIVVIEVQTIWQSGLVNDLKGLAAAVLLGPVFAFVAIAGRTPRWGLLRSDLSKRVTWKSVLSRKD